MRPFALAGLIWHVVCREQIKTGLATMLRLVIAVLMTGFLGVASADPAAAERRVALVVGNSAYEHVTGLANPRNDAEAISSALRRLGFRVIEGLDLRNREFELKVREFTRAIRGAEIALLFYAGHGLQVNGRNYLTPIDTQLLDEADLDFETIPLDMIMRQMEHEERTNLVFLDACRNNPLARNLALTMGTRAASIGRGLAPVETGIGTLISYATQPGNVALDGEGVNSPFTTSLLKHIETPGEDIAVILRRVRSEVIRNTDGKQVPWGNSSLTGKVILNPVEQPANEPEPEPETRSPSSPELELSYWESIKDAEDKSFFEAYLQQFPGGTFANLAKLKIQVIERRRSEEDSAIAGARAELESRSAEEARLAGELRELAEVENQRLAKEADAARREAEEARLAADKRLAELEAIRRQREEDDALRARQLAEAEAARKAVELRLAEIEAQRARQTVEDQTVESRTGDSAEMAALEQPEPVVEPEPEPQIDPRKDRELVRSIQKELNRLGCSAGRADGFWGRKTARALGAFSKNAKTKLVSLEPSADLLERLRGQTARVCPLVCGRGKEEENGRCVSKARRAAAPAKPENQRSAQPASQRPPARSQPTQKARKAGSRPNANVYASQLGLGERFVPMQIVETKYGTLICNWGSGGSSAVDQECRWK